MCSLVSTCKCHDPVNYLFLSAGCSPPIPPVNGSVNGFTSSRVGAQVTYHCDTDLVLMGERVATCSQSLQWLPSSQSVTCVQMPGKFVMYREYVHKHVYCTHKCGIFMFMDGYSPTKINSCVAHV